MDSIWFRFSVESMVPSGHGRKVRPKSQGENRHSTKQIEHGALPAGVWLIGHFLRTCRKNIFKRRGYQQSKLRNCRVRPSRETTHRIQPAGRPLLPARPFLPEADAVHGKFLPLDRGKFRCALVEVEGCDRSHNGKLLEHVVRPRDSSPNTFAQRPRSAAPAGMRVAELFGATPAVRFAVACAIAYLFRGHSGIYTAQRTDLPKKSTG